jgi:nucleoside-diphosphate-sugar epimerase
VKVVVTGAAGFIGSHVAARLLALGSTVVGVDCFVPYYGRELKERNLARLRSDEHFRFYESDLRHADLCPLVADADVVIHEAAIPGHPQSWSDFESYSSCNVVGTQRLLAACVEVGVPRFVHISTSSVYGEHAVGDESVPLRPISPYGVTKLAAEHLVAAYRATSGLSATVLRYFSVYGPGQRPDMAFNRFIDSLAAGRPITVFGDGTQSRSPK